MPKFIWINLSDKGAVAVNISQIVGVIYTKGQEDESSKIVFHTVLPDWIVTIRGTDADDMKSSLEKIFPFPS